jgi:hypothetical protein
MDPFELDRPDGELPPNRDCRPADSREKKISQFMTSSAAAGRSR